MKRSSIVWRAILRAWRLPWARRRLYGAAAFELYRARLLLSFVPFERLSGTLGTPGPPAEAHPDAPMDDGTAAMIQDVSRAVALLARVLPGRLVCLPQAMAAQRMLRRRGLPSTLHLGVRSASEGRPAFEAHAWLTCGGTVVTGAAEHQAFAPLATFRDGHAPVDRG